MEVRAKSLQILKTARDSILEAAQARFQKNFGTQVCDRCEGLRAGPGVVATCFQRRLCFYDNFKLSDVSSKQKRVIEALTRPQKKT